jgi:glutamate synthase domain-containing protein 3
MNFMIYIAREVREIMASLGFRRFDDMVGRSDLLEVNHAMDHYKMRGLDLSKIFDDPAPDRDAPRRCLGYVQADFSKSLDSRIIADAKEAIEHKSPVSLSYSVRNSNRTIGAMLSSGISRRYGLEGLPEDTIDVKLTGSAGQSFGAFLARGITLSLEGEANDYFGKGLSGGKLAVFPPKESPFQARRNIITGNVNLFGATGGEAYINGRAGERFAVRNSGAVAVVEGVGDHGCEYMTGGAVIVLGETGINFAAGMSGGIAYVLDENQLFDTRCNLEMVDVEQITEASDEEFIRRCVERHVQYTGSPYGSRILDIWDEALSMFVKVIPIDYKKALERINSSRMVQSESAYITEEVGG